MQQDAAQVAADDFANSYDLGDAPEPDVTPAPAPIPDPAAAPLPAHPAWLVRMALDQGFSDDEIQATPTDLLGASVQRTQIAVQRAVAEQQRAQALADSQRPQALPTAVAQGQPSAPAAADELDLGDTTEFAPEFVNLLKKAVAAPLKEIKKLKAQLAQREQAEAARLAETKNQQIDRVIDALGQDFTPYFGKGSGQHVKAHQPVAFQNRLKLIKAAEAIDSWNQNFEQSLRQAARMFAENEPEAVGLDQAQRDWNAGGLARPTSRKPAPEPPGPARARKNLARAMAAIGTEVGGSPDNGKASLEDFPE